MTRSPGVLARPAISRSPGAVQQLTAAIALSVALAACGGSSATPKASPLPSSTPPPYHPGPLSVTVLPSTGPHTLTAKTSVITLHLLVRGLHFDSADMGGNPASGQGHVQVYLDRVPPDAYTRPDLKGVTANVASPVFSVGFMPTALKNRHGRHRLLVTLARNDYTLYRVKPAVISVTFR